ncbi:MAG: hypothetical protein Q9160_002900 [Pyrenula sp. 1 TL-2023]
MATNGTKLPLRPKHNSEPNDGISRADEVENLLNRVLNDHILPYFRSVDAEVSSHIHNSPDTLFSPQTTPESLAPLLPLDLPASGSGHAGLLSVLTPLFKHSINTSSPGFLDKLYSAPSPPGLAADLILAALNTNLHVYAVAPALTLIERETAAQLAALFGLSPDNGCPRAGGISVQGGSASNSTSIVVARTTLFPRTKTEGNWAGAGGKELVLFTSAHGHYSIEKAAQACGLGSRSVISVPVIPETGNMDPEALARLIAKAKQEGKQPFYVNATAGTTVLGSFDPFPAIAEICRRENCWMHIDASWGGGFVFSPELRRTRLKGAELADSIAFNPHKMLQVPLTCSFLLGRDMRQFQRANEISAGYLFHSDSDNAAATAATIDDETLLSGQTLAQPSPSPQNGTSPTPLHPPPSHNHDDDDAWTPPTDLATLTLQCGRRGDSLKLFLAWHYYGTSGFSTQITSAYATACHLLDLVRRSPVLVAVPSQRVAMPQCLQVCFWYDVPKGGKGGVKCVGEGNGGKVEGLTARIVKELRIRGFWVDYAPPTETEAGGKAGEGEGKGEGWRGPFFRVVVNLATRRETVEGLVRGVVEIGGRVVGEEKGKGGKGGEGARGVVKEVVGD